MAKLLFLLLLAALAVVVWKLMVASGQRRTAAKPASRELETIVRCSRCDVHLPRSEAIVVDGRFFCSAEHERESRAVPPG